MMPAAAPPITPDFRHCLAMPPSRYSGLLSDVGPDLDAQMAKTLLDYKLGRYQQALKRLTHLIRTEGLDPDIALLDQLGALSERQAPLLIFELLFLLTSKETPLEETFWRYLDTISSFDPDDAICQGALYNVLTLFALRRSDTHMAEQLCGLADNAYAQCGSDYLRGFIHLHQAYIAVYRGRLANASAALARADGFFGTVPDTDCERAMVEITRLWVDAEATGRLPTLEQLRPLKETLFAGEIWPETYLVLAALHLRSAEDDPLALQYHGEIEAILRLRGMTHLLPVMQLLREDLTRRKKGDRTWLFDHADLSERHVLLLLADAETVVTNWGRDTEEAPLALDRMRAARDLALAARRLSEGRFDLAAPPFWAAIDLIEAQGWVWLARRERETIALFCRECLTRRRFVDRARIVRDTLLNAPESDSPCPAELTSAEFGIVRRLTGLTNNKRLAREMGVSEAAVKFHLRNIYKKLGVHRRADALNAARSRGWIAATPAQSGR